MKQKELSLAKEYRMSNLTIKFLINLTLICDNLEKKIVTDTLELMILDNIFSYETYLSLIGYCTPL